MARHVRRHGAFVICLFWLIRVRQRSPKASSARFAGTDGPKCLQGLDFNSSDLQFEFQQLVLLKRRERDWMSKSEIGILNFNMQMRGRSEISECTSEIFRTFAFINEFLSQKKSFIWPKLLNKHKRKAIICWMKGKSSHRYKEKVLERSLSFFAFTCSANALRNTFNTRAWKYPRHTMNEVWGERI